MPTRARPATIRPVGRRRRWLVAALAVAGVASASPADAVTVTLPTTGRWLLVDTRVLPTPTAGQGSATVHTATGTRLVTRGSADIPSALAAAGWTHVGDPSSWRGAVLDAYQRPGRAAAKLFVLTTADGVRHELLHRLVPGEQANNSFAAVAPAGRWFVSGEWGTMHRLLVFAGPATTTTGTRALRLAGTIALSTPVNNVQGCAFETATVLLCSTNDATTTRYASPRQLLSIRLAHGLGPGTTAGTVTLAGTVPPQTVCPVVTYGPGEVEGLDVHGTRLTVAVNASCAPRTDVFTYVLRTPRSDIDPNALWAVVQVPQTALHQRTRQPDVTARI